MNQIYLDNAAATPVDPRVLAAMQPYFTEKFYNPSALYLSSKAVAQDIAEARQKVAGIIGCRPAEVTFTAGGTEANNLAIHGVMSSFPGSHVVASAVEHDSVLESVKEYDHTLAPVLADGRVDVEALRHAITDKTVLVSIMLVNNEIGTVMPLARIAEVVQEIRETRKQHGNDLPLFLHSDAAQAPLYLDIHVKRLGIDMLTLNGGKIYGPKQSGVLYVASHVPLKARIVGGGQEFGRRSGTENVAGIIGFSKALEIATAKRPQVTRSMKALQDDFMTQLKKTIPQIEINGSLKFRTPNNVHVTIPGCDNERLLMELDERGIVCAVGSACSASSDEPSHVLKAIGLTDAQAQSSLRFTMGRHTTPEEIAHTVTTLTSLVASAA